MQQAEQNQINQASPVLPEQIGGCRCSRRKFLISLATVTAGSVLAACGNDAAQQAEAQWPSMYPQRILPSAQPPDIPTPVPTPQPGQLSLEQFLVLSAVLTGFDAAALSPAIGRVYLESLQQRSNPQVTLLQLYEQAGFDRQTPPTSIEDLQPSGIFDDDPTRSLADTITEYWYTGIYGSGDNQQVATYVDALAWEAVTFTKPRSICGQFPGFWREPPPVIP